MTWQEKVIHNVIVSEGFGCTPQAIYTKSVFTSLHVDHADIDCVSCDLYRVCTFNGYSNTNDDDLRYKLACSLNPTLALEVLL